MAAHIVGSRRVLADPPSAEHLALAESAREQGLPEPTVFEWVETAVLVEDVDGFPLETRVVREAAVGNCEIFTDKWDTGLTPVEWEQE